jgi:hypothetical protein
MRSVRDELNIFFALEKHRHISEVESIHQATPVVEELIMKVYTAFLTYPHPIRDQ